MSKNPAETALHWYVRTCEDARLVFIVFNTARSQEFRDLEEDV